jgi:hypothetical protein
MANTFKNAVSVVNVSPGTVLYTAPSNTQSVIHTLSLANTSSLPHQVTVQFIDLSLNVTRNILVNAPIPAGSTLVFPKPINLEQGDSIRIVGSAAASIEAFASILEIT